MPDNPREKMVEALMKDADALEAQGMNRDEVERELYWRSKNPWSPYYGLVGNPDKPDTWDGFIVRPKK